MQSLSLIVRQSIYLRSPWYREKMDALSVLSEVFNPCLRQTLGLFALTGGVVCFMFYPHEVLLIAIFSIMWICIHYFIDAMYDNSCMRLLMYAIGAQPQYIDKGKNVAVACIVSTMHLCLATICAMHRNMHVSHIADSYAITNLYTYVGIGYFLHDGYFLYTQANSTKIRVVFTVHHSISLTLLIYFLPDVNICPRLSVGMLALESVVVFENIYQFMRALGIRIKWPYLLLRIARIISYVYVRLWLFWRAYTTENPYECVFIMHKNYLYYIGWGLFCLQWLFVTNLILDLKKPLLPSKRKEIEVSD